MSAGVHLLAACALARSVTSIRVAAAVRMRVGVDVIMGSSGCVADLNMRPVVSADRGRGFPRDQIALSTLPIPKLANDRPAILHLQQVKVVDHGLTMAHFANGRRCDPPSHP